MQVSTRMNLEGKKVEELGLVTAEVVMGANVVKDLFASFTDFFGGRSGAYETALKETKEKAIEELKSEGQKLGADAILGVKLDFDNLGKNGSMFMVNGQGTAVKFVD